MATANGSLANSRRGIQHRFAALASPDRSDQGASETGSPQRPRNPAQHGRQAAALLSIPTARQAPRTGVSRFRPAVLADRGRIQTNGQPTSSPLAASRGCNQVSASSCASGARLCPAGTARRHPRPALTGPLSATLARASPPQASALQCAHPRGALAVARSAQARCGHGHCGNRKAWKRRPSSRLRTAHQRDVEWHSEGRSGHRAARQPVDASHPRTPRDALEVELEHAGPALARRQPRQDGKEQAAKAAMKTTSLMRQHTMRSKGRRDDVGVLGRTIPRQRIPLRARHLSLD